MSFTRRQVIKGATASVGLLLFGGLGNYLFKHHLPLKYNIGSLGAFALLYSNKSEGFESHLALSAAAILESQGSSKNIENYFCILVFDPSGNLRFKKEISMESLTQQTVTFDDLGWGSAIIAMAVPKDSQLPEMDSVATLQHQTPFGKDGHHMLTIREAYTDAFHTVFSPSEDEEHLIAFFNPQPQQAQGKVEFFNKAGKSFHSVDVTWNPFGTQYFSLGKGLTTPPGTHLIPSIAAGEPILVRASGKGTGGIISSAWNFKKGDNRFFGQAHGVNFIRPPKKEDVLSTQTLNPKFQQAKFLGDVIDEEGVYPGDFLTLDQTNWKTKVVIPNIFSEPLSTGIFVSNPEGKLIANSFQLSGPIIVPPMGIAEFEVDSLLTPEQQKQFSTFTCFFDNKLPGYHGLSKAISKDHLGRRMFQHLRPRAGYRKIETLNISVIKNNPILSDYWLGGLTLDSQSQIYVLIRNNSIHTEEHGLLLLFNDSEVLSTIKVSAIPAMGFQVIQLARPKHDGFFGLRLTGHTYDLKFSTFEKLNPDIFSIRHASTKRNAKPSLFDLKKWV